MHSAFSGNRTLALAVCFLTLVTKTSGYCTADCTLTDVAYKCGCYPAYIILLYQTKEKTNKKTKKTVWYKMSKFKEAIYTHNIYQASFATLLKQ